MRDALGRSDRPSRASPPARRAAVRPSLLLLALLISALLFALLDARPSARAQTPPEDVEVTLTPEVVSVGEQVVATADVTGPDGEPIRGVRVLFSADGLEAEAGDGEAATGITDDNGRATVTYIAVAPGTATVVAEAGNAVGRATVDVLGPPATIELTADPPALRAGQFLLAVAFVYDAAGNALPGVEVTFDADGLVVGGPDGPASGTAITDEDGVALLEYYASAPGSALLAASAGRAITRTVVEVGQPIDAVEIAVEPSEVEVGGSVEVSVRVTDAAGEPVAGAALVIESDLLRAGDLEGPQFIEVVTGDGGEATVTFYAPAAGTATLVASVDAVAASASVEVRPAIGGIALSAATLTPVVDDAVAVRALVTDSAGEPLPGVEVEFASDVLPWGSPDGPLAVTVLTDGSGVARAEFFATIEGSATITAETVDAFDAIDLEVQAVTPATTTATVVATGTTTTDTPAGGFILDWPRPTQAILLAGILAAAGGALVVRRSVMRPAPGAVVRVSHDRGEQAIDFPDGGPEVVMVVSLGGATTVEWIEEES